MRVCARMSTDDLTLAQGPNGLDAIAELAEHVVGVLADTRRNMPQPSRGVTEFESNAGLSHRAEFRILVLDHHLTMLDMRVIKCFLHRIHRPNTNIFVRQK